MSKSLVRSFSIGRHFENFIAGLIKEGRYSTASEVVRDSLRLLELQYMRNQSQQTQHNASQQAAAEDRLARERAAQYLLDSAQDDMSSSALSPNDMPYSVPERNRMP